MSAEFTLARLRGLLLMALCVVTPCTAAQPTSAEIDDIVRRTMDEFRVPGIGVSVVHDGEIVYANGLGSAEIGSGRDVDDRTLFQIGSVSKAFTAAALAVLADAGKLDWDDPVIDYIPEFRMQDPWVTREFTIRDLLTHRSGLPLGAGDLLMIPKARTTRDEIIRAMRYLTPATSFRSAYAYDNLLYIIAGEVVARVSGRPFEEFLEEELLAKLGMKDCSATLDRAPRRASKATPHVLTEDGYEITDSLETSLISAAGGINCSAIGMALWMQFLLDEGVAPDGERLISEAQFAELFKPVTLLPGSNYVTRQTASFLNAYALGWGVSTFYGQPAYSHGGGLWGMTTFIILLPEQDLGVFVSNNLLSPAPRAAANAIVDAWLDGIAPGAGKDWIAIVSEANAAREAQGEAAVAEAEASRAADSRPSLPLEAYAGTYRDPWYGDISIALEDDGRLHFRSARSDMLTGPLEHFQYDTFIVRWQQRNLDADAYVSFSLTADGSVERIRMQAVSPTTDFSFDFHDLDLRRVD